MPRQRVAAHLRAARTCNAVLSSLLIYRGRDRAIASLEQQIRRERVRALLAAERAARAG